VGAKVAVSETRRSRSRSSGLAVRPRGSRGPCRRPDRRLPL